ncbi:MAG: hypothetical protein UV53_C0028G0006 [Candidatus Azambacteria bacterium GW2011_GWE1_42_9]|nr:MAG: hypothetical protein UU33_C0001G0382 [Candidatus Azambacteria bacterium GW2011_GWF1_41_10]KKS49416.1 MAG: hypothetical protein UV14_C0001G0162 [Candidatus Azambacteria bacterium GW2011_GWF2_42_22]KKS69741.1 MAG: hypothetical protein UV39_C0003G0018 [Candidatus Azambacteria bacterium GW2011_GWA2_42_62]KKS74065.1 MAG: hypothetical protein UV45_C0014G0018 [Candidatus Azambacteria bacterium GW2011_GWB1_42_72]KKS78668.1 MAG: hypothetical protein UV53_C0028G0006 [Candidatus Azambacteria bacte
MAEQVQNLVENIIIRTMKGDLSKMSQAISAPSLADVAASKSSVETKKQNPVQQNAASAPERSAWTSASHEARIPALNVPVPKLPAVETRGQGLVQQKSISAQGRIIPPKNIPELPLKPLYKTTPTWIKLGFIGLAVIAASLSGLFGYWKYFIRDKAPTIIPPTATTTVPILPTAPTATTTVPIKFFNKLPNKSVTIDLPLKTADALIKALKSEAKVDETRASVKQIKITYKGDPLITEEFLSMMSIFTPKDFLLNYEKEFAFAFFNQKEGVRPILILKAKDADFAKAQMESWEKTSLSGDIAPLFLDNAVSPKPQSTFKSYSFINQPVRYLNIGKAFASLNYALYENYLVFTASSPGMFVILQDLIGQGVSIDYLKSLEASINKFVK